MKFFHLSDLHIGKQLHHYNMIAEQRDILGKIVALAERAGSASLHHCRESRQCETD